MLDYLILNAKVVNQSKITELDVAIKDGVITKIAQNLSSQVAKEVIDAKNMWLLPGLIDDQVHFREPGLTHKGDIQTESIAAIVGGVTSYFDMPNNNPPISSRLDLERKYALALGRSAANYAFYMAASNDNLEEIKALEKGEACGVKIFMGASTGNILVDNINTLEGIFANSQNMLVTHCEDTPIIEANEKAALAKYGDNIPMYEHGHIRSREACLKSSQLAVSLAKKFAADLHILHLTTADEMALLDEGFDVAAKKITGEACVHHLWFNQDDYEQLGTKIKCNPSIKLESDRLALLDAINSGKINIVATDHAPHTLAEKTNKYMQAPSGLPLVQHHLSMLLDLHQQGAMSLELLVQLACHNPAIRFGVKNRGFINEGYFADLVLINPAGAYDVNKDNILYKCAWSPLEGHKFDHNIFATWVNGIKVFADGKVLHTKAGKRLEFI